VRKAQNIKDWIVRSLRHITQDYSKSDDDSGADMGSNPLDSAQDRLET